MIKVKAEGYEEYWAREHKCPYCDYLHMHRGEHYCCNCGKSFSDVEFLYGDD